MNYSFSVYPFSTVIYIMWPSLQRFLVEWSSNDSDPRHVMKVMRDVMRWMRTFCSLCSGLPITSGLNDWIIPLSIPQGPLHVPAKWLKKAKAPGGLSVLWDYRELKMKWCEFQGDVGYMFYILPFSLKSFLTSRLPCQHSYENLSLISLRRTLKKSVEWYWHSNSEKASISQTRKLSHV